MTSEEALQAAVEDAMSPTARRHEIETLQQANDARVQALAADGFGIKAIDVVAVRLQMLIEQAFGDMDAPRRLDYEEAVQRKFSELLTGTERDAARAKLTQGLQQPKQSPLIIDPRDLRRG